MKVKLDVRSLVRQVPFGTLSGFVADEEVRLQGTGNAERRLAAIRTLCPDHPIEHLDVGARDGIDARLEPYAEVLAVTMVEPDPAEAARLRARGHHVIDRLIGETDGTTATLHLTAKPGCASTLPPNPPVATFVAPSDDRFRVVSETEMTVTSIERVAADRGRGFDDIKLDVQGGELAALRGLGPVRPFHLAIEVSTLELYSGQPLLYEVGTYLTDLGYALADLNLSLKRWGASLGAREPLLGERCRGVPVAGDAYFVPDWTRPAGRRMIAADPRKWASVLIMRGYGDLVEGICRTGDIPGAAAILAALGNGRR